MSSIKCPCGEKYKFSLKSFDKHTKDDHHLDWIYQITIDCPCGTVYDYRTQNNHFRSDVHKTWQSLDPIRFNQVQYICRCGVVFNYDQKDQHLENHPTS